MSTSTSEPCSPNPVSVPDDVQEILSATSVIIPTLNEESSLPLVLRDLPAVREVIVVDNGSSDRSAEVARELGAKVVSEPRRGYGSACLAGLAHVRRQLANSDPTKAFVAFLDADFSDHPEELINLARPICLEEAEFVLGSRILGSRERGAMVLQAYFGNKLACFLMWLFFGTSYSDLGPFRIIRWETLERLQMEDTNFGWTIEMQIKAKKLGVKTIEIPVRYRKRVGISKISGTLSGTIKAGYKILYTIFRYAWITRRFGTGTETATVPKPPT